MTETSARLVVARDFGGGAVLRTPSDNASLAGSIFDESRSVISRLSAQAAPPTNVKGLVDAVIPGGAALPRLDQVLGWATLEEGQAHAWYASVAAQPVLARRLRGGPVYEEVQAYVSEFVRDHRFLAAP